MVYDTVAVLGTWNGNIGSALFWSALQELSLPPDCKESLLKELLALQVDRGGEQCPLKGSCKGDIGLHKAVFLDIRPCKGYVLGVFCALGFLSALAVAPGSMLMGLPYGPPLFGIWYILGM